MISKILLVLGLGSCFDSTLCSLLARPRTCGTSPVKRGDKDVAIEERIDGFDAFFG